MHSTVLEHGTGEYLQFHFKEKVNEKNRQREQDKEKHGFEVH